MPKDRTEGPNDLRTPGQPVTRHLQEDAGGIWGVERYNMDASLDHSYRKVIRVKQLERLDDLTRW